MADRRKEPRIPVVLEATWHGHSGGGQCRVTDMSWHGCFVQATFGPGAGDDTNITVVLGNESVGFRGRVPYVEQRMGFSLQFDGLTPEQIQAMSLVLGAPPAGYSPPLPAA
jgi:hypothetical protein